MTVKTRVVLLFVLLVAGTGLIGYFATRDLDPVPTGPADRDEPVEVASPPVAMGRPGTLTGIVRVFRTKEPAADIEVRIEGAGDPIVTETNARGIFAARVPSGPEVTVTAYAPDPYADVVIHGVSVKPDATTSLGTLFLERALLVKGIVVDRAGNPVPGAAVSAHRPVIGDSPATDIMSVLTRMTKLRTPLDESVTGDDGRFQLAKLSPGTYRIEARAEGFAVGAVQKAAVSPESVRVEHRIILGPGAGLTGKVTTANGHPVTEALVSVVRMTDDPLNPFAFSPVQATTDERGLFSFENLSPGKASVAVRATGYPTTMLNDVNIGMRDSLIVVLGGAASIRGRVTVGEGEGVEGATILVTVGQQGGAFGETTTDADGRYRMENLPEGRIQFMRVEAAGLASWPVFNNPMMFQKGFGELIAEKELVKDIELSRGSRVFGRVTSEADGQPIGGASVYMMAAFSSVLGAVGEAVTDEDGNYEIVGVPRGLHQVVVKAAGFYQTGLHPMFMQRAFGMGMGNKAPENAPEVTTADGGPDQRLDVALKTGAIAVGTVLTPDGDPVAGARVTVAAKPNPSMMFMPAGPKPRGPTGITDEQGHFRLIGLEAGSTVKFEAEADGWVMGESEPVSLAAGQETAGIVVKLRRGGFITGTIASYRGGPLAGVEIRTLVQPSNATGNPWLWELELSSREPVLTDEQGRFRVSDLAPGLWILRASAPGHRVVTKFGIEVPGGADGGPIDMKLERGLQITGVVVDADGKAIPGVNLRASAATGAGPGLSAVRHATTDEKGAFTLDQFEPGQYSITINAKGYANRSHPAVDAGTRDLQIVLEKGLSISGRVLMPDGGPASNIWVSTRSETGHHEVDQTSEDGTFQVENLPEGLYRVHASNGGAFRFGGGKDEGSSLMPAAREGVRAGTTNLELRLQAGATIEGRVTDENGDPIQRASVFARTVGEGQTRNEWGTTDESGEFRITGLVPGTRVMLSVSHGDYGPLAGEEVNADATGLTFVLPPKPGRSDEGEGPDQPLPR